MCHDLVDRDPEHLPDPGNPDFVTTQYGLYFPSPPSTLCWFDTEEERDKVKREAVASCGREEWTLLENQTLTPPEGVRHGKHAER